MFKYTLMYLTEVNKVRIFVGGRVETKIPIKSIFIFKVFIQRPKQLIKIMRTIFFTKDEDYKTMDKDECHI